MGKLGPEAREAGPKLDEALASKTFRARVEAAVARWRITGEAEPTVRVLIEELKNPNVPWKAAEGFATVGSEARSATPELIEVLEADRVETRLFAVKALVAIDTDSQSVRTALEERMQGDSPALRAAAREALQQLESSEQHGSPQSTASP